jgi:dCTP deaminase
VTTLTDADIEASMQKGELIKNGVVSQLSGACYELRLGTVYYDLTEGDRRIAVPSGGTILIKPGHRVVLITHEELELPNNILARVVSKGSLFSIGLSPAATYADPGFSGNLGIVTQNISDHYIVLSPQEPVAKVEFTKLSGNVTRPYRGQHGFRTEIWPIKHQLQKTYKEVVGDPRLGSEKEEGYKLLPQATADIVQRLERRRLWIDIAIVGAVIFNAISLFLVGSNLINNFQGLAGNLVAALIVGLMAIYVDRK